MYLHSKHKKGNGTFLSAGMRKDIKIEFAKFKSFHL